MIEKTAREVYPIKYISKTGYWTTIQMLSLPKDVLENLMASPKNKNLINSDPEKLAKLFFDNGAILCGKNAGIDIENSSGFKYERDYSDTGILLEERGVKKNGELFYRLLEPSKHGRFTVKHEVMLHLRAVGDAPNQIYASFYKYQGENDGNDSPHERKAGRHGLISEMQLSFEKGLTVMELEGWDVTKRDEGKNINTDIATILENRSCIAEDQRELAAIILPIQETIELSKQSYLSRTL